MKNKLAIYSIAVAAMVGTLPAHAEITAYGRVTYNAILDDTTDDVFFGRHEFAESNFGIKGSKKWGNITIGANVEVGLNEGVSNLTQTGNNARTRIQQISVSSKKYGTLKLGSGPAVTWVVSDVDQSGTWFSDPLGVSSRFGASRRGPAGQSQTPFVQGQGIFGERVRYDSPKFWGGAVIQAQLGEDNSNEIAFKYVGKNGIRFNVWNSDYGDGDNDSNVQENIDGVEGLQGFFGAERGRGVLLAYKHSSGFNINTTHVIADQFAGGDRDLSVIKLGYTVGKHAVSISQGYYGSEDATGASGPDHERTTFAYNFKPVAGIQFWAQATNGDTDGEESFNSFVIGGLVKL